ncbi:MAG: hypothetical protein ABL908_00040 [Hyphomicrobium sp.]
MSWVRAIAFATVLAATGAHAAGDHDAKPGERIGIWKSVVPPIGMTGEFGNHDPIGLAAGAVIKVDCALNWIDPDDHKLYCFNSPTAVEYFRRWPKRNAERAREAWKKLQPTQ